MKWTSDSPGKTWEIAKEFYATLEFPAVVALHGNLGAGKTCFTQGLAQAAGVREPVCSPTYTLVSEYEGTIPFYHFDLYRLSGPQEALDLGFDEYMESNGLTVIEWAERAAELIPAHTIHLNLSRGDDENTRFIEQVDNPL